MFYLGPNLSTFMIVFIHCTGHFLIVYCFLFFFFLIFIAQDSKCKYQLFSRNGHLVDFEEPWTLTWIILPLKTAFLCEFQIIEGLFRK